MSTSRRAHHKSRGGCTTCKTKKVKCDEAQPCSYCVKRNLSCSLAPTKEDSRTPDVIVPRAYEAPSFVLNDFGLYRHFMKSTAVAQADDSSAVTIWRDIVADLATEYPYLLHEILALAALHLRTYVPEQAETLERTAAEHQAKALPLFREALGSMSTETAVPLFACSCLFIPYHFAAANDASSLLFNEETGSLAEWLILIQGCAAITLQHSATLMRSSLRAHLGDLYTPEIEHLSNGPTDTRLLDLASELPISPEQRDVYMSVMVRLRVCYYISDQANTSLDRKNAALRFPPLMDQSFRADLAEKQPAALVVMAFWCVLLQRVEERWWLKGRVKPLMLKIEELVPEEYRFLIAWPMEEAGVHQKASIWS